MEELAAPSGVGKAAVEAARAEAAAAAKAAEYAARGGPKAGASPRGDGPQFFKTPAMYVNRSQSSQAQPQPQAGRGPK